jgi:flagellar biosynthesis/type III secretory pathway protein FliH
MPVILAIPEAEVQTKPVWTNSLSDPISKKPNTKQGWWGSSSGRAPPSKCEALNSNPSTKKEKRERKEGKERKEGEEGKREGRKEGGREEGREGRKEGGKEGKRERGRKYRNYQNWSKSFGPTS